MSADTIRWGILGTADIARKNWLAIRNSGNGIVAGVASRDRERAGRFIQNCQSHASMPEPPQAFGSYEELLSSGKIDAVYIPLPTGLRKEWVVRASAAGKHVLCEKPCAATLLELEEMLHACQAHRVQFMDGVMFMHSARLPRIREALDDQQMIGSIRRITSAFSFCAPEEFYKDNIRAHAALEPHGCLGDLGWYCIRFALWAMRWQMPREVTGRILARAELQNGQGAVLTEFSGELLFEGGASAGFFCSFLAQNEEWAQVSGSNGYLRLEDFVVPFDGDRVGFNLFRHQFVKSGCEFKMAPGLSHLAFPEHSQAAPDAQESNMFRAFGSQIRSGRLNEEWPRFAHSTQAVMEACLCSARSGVPALWSKEQSKFVQVNC
jgi:predicted dehydrogenase